MVLCVLWKQEHTATQLERVLLLVILLTVVEIVLICVCGNVMIPQWV